MAYTDINTDSKFYEFENDTWTLINPFEDTTRLTIISTGASPVTITYRETDNDITDEEAYDDDHTTIRLGGINYEISNPENTFVFAKCSGEQGRIMVRRYGSVNPFEDTTSLATSISEISINAYNHYNNFNNPHVVTKEQIGLDNLPNALTNEVTTNDSEILPTSIVTNSIYNNIEEHKVNTNNPHQVTKEQIGLSNVDNYPTANSDEFIDGDLDNVFLTPKSASSLITFITQPSTGAKAQTIIEGNIGTRPTLWTSVDSSTPSLLLEKASDYSLKIYRGLRVCFADEGKARISELSTEDYILEIPSVITTTTYYIYAEISPEGFIPSFDLTDTCPNEGFVKDGVRGDFYNVGLCTMYDSALEPIRRVYIGKVYVYEGLIQTVTSVPFGYEYTAPVETTLALSGRYVETNPYISMCDTFAEVYYDSLWGETRWNDQMGTIASPHGSDPQNKTILQIGDVAFLACGNHSGTGLGDSFDPIVEPLKTRIRYRKRY